MTEIDTSNITSAKPERRKFGVCPCCHRRVVLRADGQLRMHGRGSGWRPVCIGSHGAPGDITGIVIMPSRET
jgi:hypothetical protein